MGAAEVGCPHKVVDRAPRRHGIRRLPHRTLADVPVDWLREQYVQRERSIIDIAAQAGVTSVQLARRLGVSPDAVSRARQRHGLSVGVVRESRYPQLETGAWLEARYVTNRDDAGADRQAHRLLEVSRRPRQSMR